MDPFLYNQRNEGLKCLMFHFIVEKRYKLRELRTSTVYIIGGLII